MITTSKTPYSNIFPMFKVPDLRKLSTDKNKELTTEQKTNIALCAFAGATVPLVAFNLFKKGQGDKIIEAFKNNFALKDKFKRIWKLFEIESYSQIFITATGGILGGLFSGLRYTNNKEDKEAKYKEGIFEFLNTMIPTTLVAGGLEILKKQGKTKSIPHQAGIILSSVAGGMFLANKFSNKINELIFDKNKKNKDIRHFKITDCLVHIDDIVNLAVLTKIPLANRLQVDKLLPLIYARTGYEVGTAEKKQ